MFQDQARNRSADIGVRQIALPGPASPRLQFLAGDRFFPSVRNNLPDSREFLPVAEHWLSKIATLWDVRPCC